MLREGFIDVSGLLDAIRHEARQPAFRVIESLSADFESLNAAMIAENNGYRIDNQWTSNLTYACHLLHLANGKKEKILTIQMTPLANAEAAIVWECKPWNPQMHNGEVLRKHVCFAGLDDGNKVQDLYNEIKSALYEMLPPELQSFFKEQFEGPEEDPETAMILRQKEGKAYRETPSRAQSQQSRTIVNVRHNFWQ